jgi:hypothetical protein
MRRQDEIQPTEIISRLVHVTHHALVKTLALVQVLFIARVGAQVAVGFSAGHFRFRGPCKCGAGGIDPLRIIGNVHRFGHEPNDFIRQLRVVVDRQKLRRLNELANPSQKIRSIGPLKSNGEQRNGAQESFHQFPSQLVL